MPEDLFDTAAKELAGVNPVSTKAPRNLFDDASDELNGVSSKLQIPDPFSVVRKTASNIEAKDPNIQTANSEAKVAQDQNNYGKSKIKDALSMLGIQGSMAVGAPVAAMKSLPWAARIGGTMGLEGTLPYEINHATTNAANKLTGDPQEPRSLPAEALSTILPGVFTGLQIRGDKNKALETLKDTLTKKNASASELQEALANYKAASATTSENLTKAKNLQDMSLSDIKTKIAEQKKTMEGIPKTLSPEAPVPSPPSVSASLPAPNNAQPQEAFDALQNQILQKKNQLQQLKAEAPTKTGNGITSPGVLHKIEVSKAQNEINQLSEALQLQKQKLQGPSSTAKPNSISIASGSTSDLRAPTAPNANPAHEVEKQKLADLLIEKTKREAPTEYMQALRQAKEGASRGETYTQADLAKVKSEIAELETQTGKSKDVSIAAKVRKALYISAALGLVGSGGYKVAHMTHLIP